MKDEPQTSDGMLREELRALRSHVAQLKKHHREQHSRLEIVKGMLRAIATHVFSNHELQTLFSVVSDSEEGGADSAEILQNPWRPIDTAPRDEQPVDLFGKSWDAQSDKWIGKRFPMASYDSANHQWRATGMQYVSQRWRITHWMPQPPPPEATADFVHAASEILEDRRRILDARPKFRTP